MHVAESTYVWPTSMYHEKHSANDMDACDCGVFCLFDKACAILKTNRQTQRMKKIYIKAKHLFK